MDEGQRRKRRTAYALAALLVNVVAFTAVYFVEARAIDETLASETRDIASRFDGVMDDYEHSFLLFSHMMGDRIAQDPNPDHVEQFLKEANDPLDAIEGDTFDGLYMYYEGRYLYSWDTPASVYEESGYVATERPWYRSAVAAEGAVAFTPPYMSYANHYILSTVSQLQPDGRTVFAYDIKMGAIQDIAMLSERFPGGQIMIYDGDGTVIGSTDEAYLGSNLHSSAAEAQAAADEARANADAGGFASDDEQEKATEEADASAAFASFWDGFGSSFANLEQMAGGVKLLTVDGQPYFGRVQREGDWGFLALAPAFGVLGETAGSWLVPLLLVELLLVYALMRASRAQKARELRSAYIELGQMQSRLEIALEAAKKDAAVDDLTGMMNARSFKKEVTRLIDRMEEGDEGIFIMLDGDHFKTINDTYGHDAGDEAIKLSAQMIVGRIRTVDVACRLHGDEFAIFLSGTSDYGVAQRLVNDINTTIAHEASKRGVPSISLSAGAIAVKPGASYLELSKRADDALYEAKAGHNGGFANGSAT